jgi:hypothetical protein
LLGSVSKQLTITTKERKKYMKNTQKIVVLIGLVNGLLFNGYSQSVIRDDFDDNQVNSPLWRTFFPSFNNASLVESDNKICFINGPFLITANQYVSNSISGRFNITGWNYDRFHVMIRSDGTTIDSHWQTRIGGLGVQFTTSSNPDFGPSKSVQLWDYQTDSLLAYASSYVTLDTPNDFVVNDDGNNISVTLNGVTVLNYSTTISYGNYIEVGNRDMLSMPSQVYFVDLDFLQINSMTEIVSVPEPSNAALALLGGIVGLVLRSKLSLKRLTS